PYVLPAPFHVAKVALGYGHTCELTDGQQVLCWGLGSSGQLGNNASASSPTPVPVSGLPADVVDLCSGSQHNCALAGTGDVYCWGNGYDGELANGAFDNSAVALKIGGLSDVVELACGGGFNCARTTGDVIYCWG